MGSRRPTVFCTYLQYPSNYYYYYFIIIIILLRTRGTESSNTTHYIKRRIQHMKQEKDNRQVHKTK